MSMRELWKIAGAILHMRKHWKELLSQHVCAGSGLTRFLAANSEPTDEQMEEREQRVAFEG